MNKTQRIIILVGNKQLMRIALEVIKGFKACTCVKSLDEEVIRNIFSHNKNVVYATTVYSMEIAMYNPIVINLTKGNTNANSMRLGINDIIHDFPKLLDSINVDVGDHSTEDSANVKISTEDCMLCRIAKGNPVREEHMLYESKRFFVVPGLGAFFDGYVMIVPKRHVMSFAELKEKEFEEFLQVLDDMKFILESIYKKKIFVFECGSGKEGSGKHATSIVHAHIHLAPTDMPVLRAVRESGINPGLIEASELQDYAKYPYMLYIDQQDNWYIASDPSDYYPRQHPRQVLADYMQLPKGEYNWRVYKHEEKMDEIAEQIYEFLRENMERLPVWVQKATKKFI